MPAQRTAAPAAAERHILRLPGPAETAAGNTGTARTERCMCRTSQSPLRKSQAGMRNALLRRP